MKNGFTLIEVLVVISILTLLTSVLLLYNRTGEQQILLTQEKTKIMGMILRAKSLSVATFVSGQPACGYGVHLTDNGYILFKDLADPCPGDRVYTTDDPAEFMENFVLGPRVRFSALPVRDILFIPPDPKVLIDGSEIIDQIKITLMAEDGGQTALSVTSAGQIGD